MTWPNENAPTPASLATDGNQGEGAKAGGPRIAQDTREGNAALMLAKAGVECVPKQPCYFGSEAAKPQPCTNCADDLPAVSQPAQEALGISRLVLKAGRCQCAACGLMFSSERAFDRHRIGAYAESGQWQGNRRCMTSAEMDLLGWPVNARGFRMQPRPGDARVDLAGACETPPATGVAGRVP